MGVSQTKIVVQAVYGYKLYMKLQIDKNFTARVIWNIWARSEQKST